VVFLLEAEEGVALPFRDARVVRGRVGVYIRFPVRGRTYTRVHFPAARNTVSQGRVEGIQQVGRWSKVKEDHPKAGRNALSGRIFAQGLRGLRGHVRVLRLV